MLEMLLTGGKPASGDPEPDVWFLWDPAQAKDLMGSAATIAYSGGGSVDSVNLIDGNPTLLFSSTTQGATITFETPLVMPAEWTVEWSTLNAAAASAYANEFAMYEGTSAYGILARYGDSGFGNRLQFGVNFGSAANCYNINLTKAGSVSVLQRFALVCKNKAISVYRNGVKQNMAAGTGVGYTASTFPVLAAATLLNMPSIRLGYMSSSVPANPSRHGRIRICRNALYTGASYTPKPF